WIPETTDFGKQFTYVVSVSGHDRYGNLYTATDSAPHSVVVNVSDRKVALAYNALQAQISAAALAVCAGIPLLGLAFGLAAAAAALAAAVLGEQALDPPSPNRRYKRAVRIISVQTFGPKFRGEALTAIGDFFDLVTRG